MKKHEADRMKGIFESSEQEMPLDTRFAAGDDLIERERVIHAENKELSSAMKQLRKDCLMEIYAVVGPETFERNVVFHEELRNRMANIPGLLEPTVEAQNQVREHRQRLAAKRHKFIESLDIDTKKIIDIRKRYIENVQELVKKWSVSEKETAEVYTSPAKAPKPTNNPWTWKHPPYSAEYGKTWAYGSRGSRWAKHAENHQTGSVECWSTMSLYGADNSDFSYTKAWSEIRIWFKMPAAGLIEAWVYLQSIGATYTGGLWDEFGCSDAFAFQESSLYLWAIYPFGVPRYGNLMHYKRGGNEGDWTLPTPKPGDFRYVHFFSQESYAAGQWVLLAIGLFDWNHFWVDDMSLGSTMVSRWMVHHLALRSTGAP